jgi:cell division protein FtsW (lipid II flippase)
MFGLFAFIGIALLSQGHSGGEEVPITLLNNALTWFVYGLLIISIVTPFFYRTWVRKYWYVNLLIATLCIYIILSVYFLNHD